MARHTLTLGVGSDANLPTPAGDGRRRTVGDDVAMSVGKAERHYISAWVVILGIALPHETGFWIYSGPRRGDLRNGSSARKRSSRR